VNPLKTNAIECPTSAFATPEIRMLGRAIVPHGRSTRPSSHRRVSEDLLWKLADR
jgi:hypothetical protein